MTINVTSGLKMKGNTAINPQQKRLSAVSTAKSLVVEVLGALETPKHLLSLVPEVGIEPTWSCPRGILSPVRLPVSPLRHFQDYVEVP